MSEKYLRALFRQFGLGMLHALSFDRRIAFDIVATVTEIGVEMPADLVGEATRCPGPAAEFGVPADQRSQAREKSHTKIDGAERTAASN